MKTNNLSCYYDNGKIIVYGEDVKRLMEGADFPVVKMDGLTLTVQPKFNKRSYARKVLGSYDAIYRDQAAFSMMGRNVVCCSVKDKRRRTRCGFAVCAPGDEFDLNVGKAIAYLRAVGKPVPAFLTA